MTSSNRHQRFGPRRIAAASMGLYAIVLLAASANNLPEIAARPAAGEGPGEGVDVAAPATEGQIRRLIVRLDAANFAVRKQATRELALQGPAAIPYLVGALGEDSSEIRYRARLLLNHHHTFEEVAPPLAAVVETPAGTTARSILRERADRQLAAACDAEQSARLFKFWGIDAAVYSQQARTRLADATTRAETMRAIEPLLGLSEKASRFGDAVSRLESLGLSCDHQHSPGYGIAETLARGLREGQEPWLDFARRHLDAFETLARQLRLQAASPHTVRKEVSDRATMSSGAAEFLVRLLHEPSAERAIVAEWMDLSPDYLQAEFCGGLAAPDPLVCQRRVGKVHIVDMLTETLRKWPQAPRDGVVQRLVASTVQTATDGDKPKALALLDALGAIRDLSSHGLDLQSDPGQQLAQRLGSAAVQAPNNRAYHPARSLHDKFVTLIDQGISPRHAAFPGELFADYVRGTSESTSDEQRLALERYVRMLERLRAAGLTLDQPSVGRFTVAMRDCLIQRRDLLAEGGTQLEQLLREQRAQGDQPDTEAVARSLNQWADRVVPF